MKQQREELLRELADITWEVSDKVIQLKRLSDFELNYKASHERWSVLECIEHLNLYGEFYLPELERRIINSKPAPDKKEFSSGLIGNYFANLMRVRDGKITVMKSPADKNPANSELTITTLDRFLRQQELLKSLLHQARETDLTRTKVSISLTPYIRLRLGDTFRFFVYHIERHVIQAENAAALARSFRAEPVV